jgi:hypothetical protein
MMAQWARYVGVFTVVLAGIAAANAVIVYYQWSVMRSQLSEMRLDSRPWISVESVTMIAPLEISKDGTLSKFVIRLKNVGKLPAIRVGASGDLIIRNHENALERQRAYCRAVRKSLADTANDQSVLKPEYTIFPDQVRSIEVRASFRPDDFKRYEEWLNRIPGSAALPTFVGCANYEFPSDAGFHSTGIIIDLTRKTPAPLGPVNAQVPGAVLFPGTTSPADINLSDSFVGTGTID